MTEDQKKVFKRIVENGRIRVDTMDALLILISEIERDASAPLERLQALLDAQEYENDLVSVGQIRRALSFSGEQEPPRCNHWPGQKRCGVCGMDNTSRLPSDQLLGEK
ncbi:hypothetical protein IVB27_32240 [Bradyrhizobium sp. 197]|uniref:hypothetical protein n=1 Tax=Bradyrhizobium sp. 197 TaxID=2782663 RepID=UPI001FF810AD|nr:hypothetical protein [Bradyrhizobium sp. 197]MCK1479284.1 hypothetical protein [Bradyrhizobium sp. 197]